jgi:ABC-type dipeptide/oligopeptide/nickel transport system ATPase subunit
MLSWSSRPRFDRLRRRAWPAGGRTLRDFRRQAQLVLQNRLDALNPRFTIYRAVVEPLINAASTRPSMPTASPRPSAASISPISTATSTAIPTS